MTEIKLAILLKFDLIWNDPEPIPGNDYQITKIVVGEETSLIEYNNGMSEAEVFNHEIHLL